VPNDDVDQLSKIASVSVADGAADKASHRNQGFADIFAGEN
jgi:hypothetical protein